MLDMNKISNLLSANTCTECHGVVAPSLFWDQPCSVSLITNPDLLLILSCKGPHPAR